MYQKYQTAAIVLEAREAGEADKAFSLFTEEFGLVRARATSVRKESSKMRYALQLYSLANVSLVRGKRGWRLAGATPVRGLSRDKRSLASFARVAEAVVRLIGGEEENRYIFETLREAHGALQMPDRSLSIEILALARVLYALGYIASEAIGADLFKDSSCDPETLSRSEAIRASLLHGVNRALSQAHL